MFRTVLKSLISNVNKHELSEDEIKLLVESVCRHRELKMEIDV